MPYFPQNLIEISVKLSSAAVVIGALWVIVKLRLLWPDSVSSFCAPRFVFSRHKSEMNDSVTPQILTFRMI